MAESERRFKYGSKSYLQAEGEPTSIGSNDFSEYYANGPFVGYEDQVRSEAWVVPEGQISLTTRTEKESKFADEGMKVYNLFLPAEHKVRNGVIVPSAITFYQRDFHGLPVHTVDVLTGTTYNTKLRVNTYESLDLPLGSQKLDVLAHPAVLFGIGRISSFWPIIEGNQEIADGEYAEEPTVFENGLWMKVKDRFARVNVGDGRVKLDVTFPVQGPAGIVDCVLEAGFPIPTESSLGEEIDEFLSQDDFITSPPTPFDMQEFFTRAGFWYDIRKVADEERAIFSELQTT